MAAHASTHAGLDPVRQAAAGLRMEQAEEIGRMRAVLTSHGVGA